MLPNEFIIILNLFDAFGCTNSGSSKLSTNRQYSFCVCFVHCSMAIILTWFGFFMITEYFPLLSPIEVLNECLQYINALVTYWLIILESFQKRKVHKHFWNVFEQIDWFFCHQSTVNLRSYRKKLISFFGFHFLLILFTLTDPLTQSTQVDLAYEAVFMMCEFRIFYYLFCLEIVNHQLNRIESELQTMELVWNFTRKFTRFPFIDEIYEPANYPFELQRFKWVRDYFHHIYEMVSSLNTFFGWSHIAVVSFCFTYILTTWNWFRINFHVLSYTNRICKYFDHSFFQITLSICSFKECLSVATLEATCWPLLAIQLFYDATQYRIKVTSTAIRMI